MVDRGSSARIFLRFFLNDSMVINKCLRLMLSDFVHGLVDVSCTT